MKEPTKSVRWGIIGTGEPMSVRAGFGMPFPEGGSRWNPELGGSTVLDQGIYHAGSVEQIFGKPEKVVMKRKGNGYTPMLRAVCEAISAGYIEEPGHDRKSSMEVARTLDAVRDLVHLYAEGNKNEASDI